MIGKWIDLEEWAATLLFVLILFWAMAFLGILSGCATASPLPSSSVTAPNAVYKYDMHGTINGAAFDGVGVIPRADLYDVKIQSRVDVDLLTITSCHRDFSVESAISQGWFSTKRGYEYAFAPVKDLEDRGSCLLRFGAYNQASASQNAWAIVDFEDPWTNMPAANRCNGETIPSNGVSICQSRAGLEQMLRFPEPMEIDEKALTAQCVPRASADKREWTYSIASGECVIAFQEIASPYRRHRLTTIGYGQILYRGN